MQHLKSEEFYEIYALSQANQTELSLRKICAAPGNMKMRTAFSRGAGTKEFIAIDQRD